MAAEVSGQVFSDMLASPTEMGTVDGYYSGRRRAGVQHRRAEGSGAGQQV